MIDANPYTGEIFNLPNNRNYKPMGRPNVIRAGQYHHR